MQPREQWSAVAGGRRAYLRGVAIFADVLGILGICFAQTWTARALKLSMTAIGLATCSVVSISGACLVEGFAVD